MAKKALVIVESPSKAKTIQKYLGKEFIVKASVGHIKDLPKSKLGINLDKNFEPDYTVIPAKEKVIAELKKYAADVPTLYLATDPDREGEAIAWHINEELKAKGKKVHRVLFNAITKPAILEAMENPQKLDENKYNAQQARRILDRLVGYKISPLLWDKVKRGISAGRVQSVALRLVVDRETEIKAFKAEEYWQCEAQFSKSGISFPARLFKINDKDPELNNKSDVDTLLSGIKKTQWQIDKIEQKERSRKAQPPFITSRLQQEAAGKLGFSAKKTMTLAQMLYEGKDLGDLGTHGLITYMRTDSVRTEPAAVQAARDFIKTTFGKEYLPSEPNFYKTKKNAQDAHEAIRPTTLEFNPERIKHFLDPDEYKLYLLIWNRFIASQMTPAIYDQTAVDITGDASDGRGITFRASGSVVKFAGFTKVYAEAHVEMARKKKAANEDEESDSEQNNDRALRLPPIKKGDEVQIDKVEPSQHFTQPPPRYTDASLIRDLEERGIGRPSTYATILSNLQDREYVEKRENKYFPSELGTVVTELLVKSFPDILNSEFTAGMENQLDEIEEDKSDWRKIMKNFWVPFEKTLEQAKIDMKDVKRLEVPTNIKCEQCGYLMVIKWGKMGSFLACSHYPECKNTQDFTKNDQGEIIVTPKQFVDKKCSKCSKPMVFKNGKFGKFYACSDYPNCKTTEAFSTGVKCPECDVGEIVEKQSRFKRVFYSCGTWPKCNFSMWDKPVMKPCPECKFPLMSDKTTKRQGHIYKCVKKECGYFELVDDENSKVTELDKNEKLA